MVQKSRTKNQARAEKDTLKTILDELRLLRREILLLVPHESLEDYAHPERIRQSYRTALRKYPVKA